MDVADYVNDIVSDVLSVITEDSLEKFIEEQSHFKIKAEKQKEDNIKLLEELEGKKDVEKELLTTKDDLLQEKLNLKEILERQKKPLDRKAESAYKNLKSIIGATIIGYYILLVVAIFYFTWDVMEQYTFILSIIPILFSVLYLLLKEQTINPLKYLRIQKENYLVKTYKEFDFDIEKLKNNEEEISKLKAEIDEIKKASR